MDDASPTEQLAYPSDRTILLQILHSIATIEQLVARILDVTEEGEATKQRQAESMATYIKQFSNPDQIGPQPPVGFQDQSRSIPRGQTAGDDLLINRPPSEMTEYSLSPSPQARNVREDQTGQACSAQGVEGTMCRTQALDEPIPAHPPTQDGDMRPERAVMQPSPKRQALEDITDLSDDNAGKRRKKHGEI